MNPRPIILVLLFSAVNACGPAAEESLPEGAAGKEDAATASDTAFCVTASTPEETGVLQLVNDPLLDASDLQHTVGLDRRAAEAIVEARPIATLGALDALPYLAKKACTALRDHACAEQRCRTGFAALTWNIELFPHSARADDVILAELQRLAPEVVAFQEILDEKAFLAMAKQLPGYQAVLAKRGYDSGVGALVKNTVTVLASQSLYPSYGYAFPRPPLQLSLQLSTGPRVEVIVVHLKAQTDAASQARRRTAIKKLAADLASTTATVILGDWNDQLTDAPDQNVFTPLVDGGYSFLTLPLAQAGKYSYPRFHSFLDHVAVDGGARQQLRPYVSDVLPLDQQDSGYLHDVSDHIPVLSRFSPP